MSTLFNVIKIKIISGSYFYTKMDVQDLDLPCNCSSIEVKDNYFILSIDKTLITELDNGTYSFDVSMTD